MLRITLEKVPFGIEEDSKVLHTGTIVNDGSGTVSRGNYAISLGDRAGKLYKWGTVKDFPRRTDSAWQLLFLALKDIFERREGYGKGAKGEEIIKFLSDYGGFDGWWDSIDSETKGSIILDLDEEFG